MMGTGQIALSTCKVQLAAVFTDTHRHTHTEISTINKFGIQPCTHSVIALPFGLAIKGGAPELAPLLISPRPQFIVHGATKQDHSRFSFFF